MATKWRSLTSIAFSIMAGLALASPASAAKGVSDGNEGLAALERGAHDEAISSFSRAIRSGGLTGDDLEFAYLNRAKAYADKQDYGHAILDLKQAISLKPDDKEAQDDLQLAIATKLQVPGAQPGQPRPDSFLSLLGKAMVQGIADGLQDSNQGQ